MAIKVIKENTEPSLKGNLLEGVETEARAYGFLSKVIMGRFYLVTNKRESRATHTSRRYSPNLLVTVGVEVNNAQPLLEKVKVTKNDQDALEQIQREQDKVWKRLVDASQAVYNDSFLFNTLNERAAA